MLVRWINAGSTVGQDHGGEDHGCRPCPGEKSFLNRAKPRPAPRCSARDTCNQAGQRSRDDRAASGGYFRVGLSVLVATHCCWAASRIEPAVRNAGFSRSAGSMGRLAARRSTIRASAVWVAYGIVKRLALAASPLTVITCWGLCCQPTQFNSGGP